MDNLFIFTKLFAIPDSHTLWSNKKSTKGQNVAIFEGFSVFGFSAITVNQTNVS